MNSLYRRFRVPLTAFLGLSLALSASPSPSDAALRRTVSPAGGTLTVYAAASLKDAFTTIGAQFDRLNSSTTRFSFAGSDTLATQITQGAPADVFASANQSQMNVVVAKGLVTATPRVFVHNKLVVIVPKDNRARIYNLADLASPGVKLVLAAPTVPVGKYARAAFAVMAHDAAFGPDFLTRIKSNIVSNETDVKAVAAKVEIGEADAGVVYVTDVTPKVAPQVMEVAVPMAYNQVASYPIAPTKAASNPFLARAFVSYVLSAPGQLVLKREGFATVSATPVHPYAPTVTVGGLVTTAATYTVADLRGLPSTTVTATLRTKTATLGTARYTGVTLSTLIDAAKPITNTSYKNDILRDIITISGADGYQVSVSLAEILTGFGHENVLLAYLKNGRALSHSDGAFELIVPGDTLAGRDVANVTSIVVQTPYGTP